MKTFKDTHCYKNLQFDDVVEKFEDLIFDLKSKYYADLCDYDVNVVITARFDDESEEVKNE